MSDVRKTRELIELIFARTHMEIPDEHVSCVLMVLDGHHLLKDFHGTAEEYHAKVQQAYRDALEAVIPKEER